MKNRIFKLAYIALAIVSMFVLKQKNVFAETRDECLSRCGTGEGSCFTSCGSSSDPACYNYCQNWYVDCTSTCP